MGSRENVGTWEILFIWFSKENQTANNLEKGGCGDR
jgi:hypothetical protein